MDVEDYFGKFLVVLEVFFKFFCYMKEEVLKKLKCIVEEKEEYKDILIIIENIYWIVIVLVIWDDYVKKFMRDVVEKVNIFLLIYYV